jgi:DNA-binding MarR family transcriptional regulator
MHVEELHSVALELHILAGILVKIGKRDLEQRLDSCGACIGPLPFGILRLLSYKERTISEIGRRMMITPATLVPVIDTLERGGLVRRGLDPRDRRRTPLSITAQGTDLLSRVPMVDRNDSLIRGLEAVGTEKSGQLLALLRDLVEHMYEDERRENGSSLVDLLHDSVREQLGIVRGQRDGAESPSSGLSMPVKVVQPSTP